MDSVSVGAVPMVLITTGRLLDSPFVEETSSAVHDPDVAGAVLALRGSPNPASAGFSPAPNPQSISFDPFAIRRLRKSSSRSWSLEPPAVSKPSSRPAVTSGATG